jgi:hypothetical protein
LKDSSLLSVEWFLKDGKDPRNLPALRKDMWSPFSSKAEKNSPLSRNTKSFNKWSERVRRWKAPRIPDSHLFSDRVLTMFVERSEGQNHEGFLISAEDNSKIMTHNQILVPVSEHIKFQMDLRKPDQKEMDSGTLYSLFKK